MKHDLYLSFSINYLSSPAVTPHCTCNTVKLFSKNMFLGSKCGLQLKWRAPLAIILILHFTGSDVSSDKGGSDQLDRN